jgi:hypothetical protein
MHIQYTCGAKELFFVVAFVVVVVVVVVERQGTRIDDADLSARKAHFARW